MEAFFIFAGGIIFVYLLFIRPSLKKPTPNLQRPTNQSSAAIINPSQHVPSGALNYTYHEKRAMVRTLMGLAMSDGRIVEKEVEVVKNALGVDDNMLKTAATIDISYAVDVIKEMSIEKRWEFAKTAVKVSEADGFVHPQEHEHMARCFALIGVSEILTKSFK